MVLAWSSKRAAQSHHESGAAPARHLSYWQQPPAAPALDISNDFCYTDFCHTGFGHFK